jgi:Peroxiredoxin
MRKVVIFDSTKNDIMLKEGDRIPAFSVLDQDGKTVTDKDLLGRRTVLYFYPKDNTPGCTAEACNLRDNIGALQAAGYTVYGVSRDSGASHVNFRSKYSLPFDLLSDPDTTMLQAYDAWGEKKLYGKPVVGAIRKTFLIAPDGTIERIIGKVDTKGHAAQIL